MTATGKKYYEQDNIEEPSTRYLHTMEPTSIRTEAPSLE